MQKPRLISLGTLKPCRLLLRGHLSIHCRRVFSKLSEGHSRVLQPEGVTHGVLVEEVGGHVTLGGVEVSGGTTAGHGSLIGLERGGLKTSVVGRGRG